MKVKSAFASFLFQLREQSVFADPVINENCTEIEVNNWTISRFILKKLVPVVGLRPFPLNEQMLLVSAVCRLKPTHIFEWGTNIGKSARIFYETCRTFGIQAEIHSIDLPADVEHSEHPGGNRGMLVKGKKGVHLYLGDGLEISMSLIYQKSYDVVRPLFFVDGDHSYESVRRELEGIISTVPRATIILHDTFYQSAESGYNIGSYNAIEDVLRSLPNQYKIYSQNLGLPGMTLLWRQSDSKLL